MPLFRRQPADAAIAPDAAGVAPRRVPAGVLRRERRALLRARTTRLGDLGGLLVEMYRRGAFREDLTYDGTSTTCTSIRSVSAVGTFLPT